MTENSNLIFFPVNFPVVAGGFALIAATGATQAVVGGATVGAAATGSLFSTSFVGGAASLLGNDASLEIRCSFCIEPFP